VTGFGETFANRVNILGRIAGAGYRLDALGGVLETHAIKWTGGVMSELGGFGGHHAAALAINDLDQVVGYATTMADATTRAFFCCGGMMTALNLFPGETESYAYDISNTGYVVGTCVAGAPARPYSWRAGITRALPIPAWSRTGAANAVNNAGIAAGTYEINQFTGEFAACAWQGATRIELGNLGGTGAYAVAADINDAGQIVGTSNSPAGYSGFLWMGGRIYDLRACW
jgi:probable HAF family extracellular repeat protein